MPQEINIPRVGLVEFPDEMSESDIVRAIETEIIPQERRERKERLLGNMKEAQREGAYASVALEAAEFSENLLMAIRNTNPFQMARGAVHLGLRAAGVPEYEAPVPDPSVGVQIPKPEGEGVLAGAGRFASDMVSFITSPEGLAITGAGAAPLAAKAAMQAGFAGTMSAQLPQTAGELGTATVEGTPADITEKALQVGLEAVVPASISFGALRSNIPKALDATVKEFLVPRRTTEQSPIVLETDTYVPKLQPYDVSKQIASTPGALGKVPGLAWMFDPRSVDRGEIGDVLLTRQLEVEVGNAQKIVLGKTLEARNYEKIFGVDAEGRVTGVKIPDTESARISDFFEALIRDPNAYRLNPEQRAAFNEIKQVLEDADDFSRHHKLRFVGEEEEGLQGTFPRQRIFSPEEQAEMAKPVKGGQSVGAKQTSEKKRIFESEAEGVANGAAYEPTIYKRLVGRVGDLYRIAADQRMAESLAPFGETVKERKARYSEKFDEEKAQLLAETPRPTEGRINQPAFAGNIYPADIANRINEFYSKQTSQLRRGVSEINQAAKGATFGFDIGGPLIQGQVLLFSNPVAWAKAVYNGTKSMISPQLLAERMRNPENITAMRELASLGVPLGRLNEYLPGDIAHPVAKVMQNVPGFTRLQRFQGEFLETGIVELWKAHREALPPTELAQFAETLQNIMGSGRMEGIGLSPNRVLLERSVLLAPALQRSAASMIAGLVQKGASGSMIRKSMAAWFAGTTALFYGMAKHAGLSDEEIAERFNPSNSRFMMWPVEIGGKRVDVGLGGPVRSMIRLGGEVTDAALNDPEKLYKPGVDENVFLRWLRGKLASVPAAALDYTTGKDFLGNDVDIKDIVKRQAPLAVQPYLVEEGEDLPPAGEILPGSLGLNIYPENIRSQFERARNDEAQKEFGKPYEELDYPDQVGITVRLKRQEPFANPKRTAKEEERLVELAIKGQQDRLDDIKKSLPEGNLTRLSALGVRLRSYDPTIRVQGITVPLTKKQLTEYKDSITREYSDAVNRFLAVEGIESMDVGTRQKVLDRFLEIARKKAKGKLVMGQDAEP